MISDPMSLADLKLQDLLVEAERERLAAQVRQPVSPMRRELALACHRLADWIDNQQGYLRPSEAGRVDWLRAR